VEERTQDAQADEQKQRKPYEKPVVEFVALTPEERLMGCDYPSGAFPHCLLSS
jgi:hypothetical protein